MKITTNPQGLTMEAITKKLDLIFCELQSLTQAVKAIVLQANDAAVNASARQFLDPVSSTGVRRSECTEVKNAIDSIVRACSCDRKAAKEALNERLGSSDFIRFDGDRRRYVLRSVSKRIVARLKGEA